MASARYACTAGWFWLDHSNHEYVVLTPDYDVFTKVLHESNPDLTPRFLLPGPNGGIPRDVSARNVYAFAPMSAADLANCTQQGRAEAESEILRRELLGQVWETQVPGPRAPFPRFEEGRRWVLAEYVPGHTRSERRLSWEQELLEMAIGPFIALLVSQGRSTVLWCQGFGC